jgi:hypothetical protein
MVVPGGNTQGIVNSKDRGVRVVPWKKHIGHSKQHTKERNVSACEEIHRA